MSEKTPKLERPPVRVFGKLPEEERVKLSQEIGRRFTEGDITEFPEQLIKEIKTLEYDKRPYEIDFINESNRVLNEIIEKYGIAPFDIPPKNVHIIPPDVYKKSGMSEVGTAATDMGRQLIALNALESRDSTIVTAAEIIHEMTHLKGFVSFDAKARELDKKEPSAGENEPKYHKAIRRVGLRVLGSYRKSDEGRFYESFGGLNEAVVSEIEQRHFIKVAEASNSSEVKDEIAWLNSEQAIELKRKLAEEKKRPIEDILWISKDGKDWSIKSYPSQRKTLDFITQEIALDEGKTKDEILDLFIKAHFTGNILTIAKLIEKTFGKNSFFVLGGMTADIQSARRTLDYLKKQRNMMQKTDNRFES